MDPNVKAVNAVEILDSRGNPTLAVTLDAERRHERPRRGALGCLDRLARSGRAPRRRRRPLWRQGRPEGGRDVNGEIAEAITGSRVSPIWPSSTGR